MWTHSAGNPAELEVYTKIIDDFNASQDQYTVVEESFPQGAYNDAIVAADLDPPLTTVALPHYEMGRWAMEVALGIRTPDDPGAPHLMPCPIVHRDSVGPPPATAASDSRRRT